MTEVKQVLVKNTGIATVPGSGMGQVAGTNHLRRTFLLPEEHIPVIIERFRHFYLSWNK
jgi:alanine transaminase